MTQIPQILYLIGPTAVGKTTLGQCLADALQWTFVDLDHEIENATQLSVAELFRTQGENGFRKHELTQLSRCAKLSHIVLACGAGAVLHPDNCLLLRKNHWVVYLEVGITQQLKRLGQNKNQHRPLVTQSTDVEKLLRQMAAVRNPLYQSIADYIVNTDKISEQSAVLNIVDAFSNHKQSVRDSLDLPDGTK